MKIIYIRMDIHVYKLLCAYICIYTYIVVHAFRCFCTGICNCNYRNGNLFIFSKVRLVDYSGMSLVVFTMYWQTCRPGPSMIWTVRLFQCQVWFSLWSLVACCSEDRSITVMGNNCFVSMPLSQLRKSYFTV